MGTIEEDWGAFVALASRWQHHGPDKFAREFRRFVADIGWGEFIAVEPREAFVTAALRFHKAWTMVEYARSREAQLVQAGFPLWVYRSYEGDCAVAHVQFNGIVLPPGHHFWRLHRPPRRADCGCRVSGAFSEAGARRRGGDPSKPLPTGWDRPGSGAAQVLHFEPPFDGDEFPDMRTIFRRAFGA